MSYEAWLLTQYNVRIKCLNLDRGGEYLSKDFSDHLKRNGTTRQLTVHDTPEHNGVAERGNHTNLQIVRAMLHDSGLPKFLWAEAISHAIYLRNRTWTRAIGETTPYELLNRNKPNLADIQPWGCKVRVHDVEGSKLDARSKVGRWVVFDPNTKDGHHVYWPEKSSITVERNIRFNFDEIMVRIPPVLEGEVDDIKSNEPQEKVVETPETPVEPIQTIQERSRCIRKESEYVKMLKEGSGVTGERSRLGVQRILPAGMRGIPENVESSVAEEYAMATVIESVEGLMPSYEEVRKRSDWPKWEEAIQKELSMLEKSDTWKLAKRPPEANVVGCKWVFRIKKNAAGEIEKYKARLVAKGFTQIYGVDYYETYAPVARLLLRR